MKLLQLIWCMLFGHKVVTVGERDAWMQINNMGIMPCSRCGLVVSVDMKGHFPKTDYGKIHDLDKIIF
jgi:hypothetical protein